MKLIPKVLVGLVFAAPVVTNAAPNPVTQSWVVQQLDALRGQIMQAISGSGSVGTPCTSSDKRCAIIATRTLFRGGGMIVNNNDLYSLPPGFNSFTDTSNTPTGALSRATQICNMEGAFLVPGSTWKPWISFSTNSGVPSASQAAASTLDPSANYYRAGGSGWIAEGSGLIGPDTGTAFLGISIDGSEGGVLTGTNALGEIYDPSDVTNSNCEDWTNSSGEVTLGNRNGTNADWTMGNTFDSCTTGTPIYCVQQVKNG